MTKEPKTTKDEAIDSLIGCDAYYVVTCRREPGLIEVDGMRVDVFAEGASEFSGRIAQELHEAVGQIVFGEEWQEEDQDEPGAPS